jgi:hypothetical protein
MPTPERSVPAVSVLAAAVMVAEAGDQSGPPR